MANVTNAEELQAKLRANMEKSAATEAAGADEASSPTAAFNSKTAKAPKSEAEKAADKQKRERTTEIRSNVAVALDNLRSKISQGRKSLMEAMSKHCYIAGYIVNNGPKTDFASKKIKKADGTDEYHIGLKMSSPSAPVAVAIMVPLELSAYFENNQFDVPENQTKIVSIKDKPFGDPSIAYRMEIKPYDEVFKFIMNYTDGTLKEHPTIVSEYIKGGKQPAHYQAGSDASALQITTKGALEKGNVTITVRHTYRSKIVTPTNYIAKKRYKTVKPSLSYSAEDAKALNTAYLGRFTKETKPKQGVGVIPLNFMDQDSTKNIFPSSDGKTINSSTFFATDGQPSWFANEQNGVEDWYLKDSATGTAVVVPASKVELVLKEEVTSNTGKTRIAVSSIPLGGANSDSPYKLDQATYGKILDLTSGQLTVEKIAAASPSKTKVGGKTVVKGSAIIKGAELAGLNYDEALAAIKASAQR